MLGRTHRFHGYNSLRLVYRRGKTVRSPRISLRFVERNPIKPFRMAVVVSRKVNKSAVVRNRIRRRIYAAAQGIDHIKPGTDLVFTVFSDDLAKLPAPELKETVRGLVQKAAEHR